MSIETGTAQSRLSKELSYPFGDMAVVSIANVPASFEEVALTLQLAQDEEGKAENKRIVFYTSGFLNELITCEQNIKSFDQTLNKKVESGKWKYNSSS